ncbi:MAG: electron transfer flavoprotein subunit alpha/FixB family protein [Atribacterota bacterium]
MDPTENSVEVLILGEVFEGKVEQTTFQAIAVGQILHQKGIRKVGVLLGSGHLNDGELDKTIHYGADELYYLENPVFDSLAYHVTARLILQKVNFLHPSIILAAATSQGTTLMPYLAAKLHTGLTADCVSFDIDPRDGKLLQIRPAIGGNIMATIKTRTLPQMATIRPNTFLANYFPQHLGRITLEKDPTNYQTGFLKNQLRKDENSLDLTEARVVCSGGRGLKNAHNFTLVEQLAQNLGAAVGASRAAVEQGWISYPHQVGLSGKTISPEVYICAGISGALQHLAGMQTSGSIVAINRDPEAQIFRVADLGLVGDAGEILPLIIDGLNRRKKHVRV